MTSGDVDDALPARADHDPRPSAETAPPGVGDGPIVVVTAIALKPAARDALAHRMGPGHVVVDIRDAGNTADIVLVPPASPQLLGALRGMFPGARLLITEFTDPDFGADFRGPVGRSIDSGADGYFVAPTMAELASATHQAAHGREIAGALTGGRGDTPLRQLPGLADDPANTIRIDLDAWAAAAGVDMVTLRRLVAPLLLQLQRQGYRILLAGTD